MHQLRTDYWWRTISRRLGYNDSFMAAFFIAGVGAVLVVVPGSIFFADSVSKYNSQADQHRHLNVAFRDVAKGVDDPVRERKQLAQQLIYLHEHEAGTALELKDVASIKAIAKTGDVLQLEDQKRDGWHEYWTKVVPLGAAIIWCVFSIILFLGYAYETADADEYLLDFRWRRVWPIFFTLFTAFPLGLPFYLVSAFRVRKARKRQAQPVEVVEQPETEAAEEGQATHVRLQFYSAPKAAKSLYCDMRSRTRTEHLARRRKELNYELESQEDALRSLGDEIKEAQAHFNELRSEAKKLEELGDEPEEDIDLLHLQTEFERLLQLRGVKGIRVINDQISLLVQPRLEYKGKLYDLSDWELRFGVGTGLGSQELRSGVRNGWSGGYPAYRLSDGEFCFGERFHLINDNLMKGQYLEAIELAVDCLHTVNEEDCANIPKAFKEAA